MHWSSKLSPIRRFALMFEFWIHLGLDLMFVLNDLSIQFGSIHLLLLVRCDSFDVDSVLLRLPVGVLSTKLLLLSKLVGDDLHD